MAETPLPSRKKWNTPHSSATAWDIAAEVSYQERRRIVVAWLTEELMTADEAQQKRNHELSVWEAERGL